MHIFLTGELQVGKSTALRKFLSMPGITADGFITFFDTPENPERGGSLLLATFDTEYGIRKSRRVAFVSEEKLEIYSEVFDTFGADVLASAGQRSFIVMDELGVFEKNSPLFLAEVMRRIDGSIPVVGVIKMKQTAFLDAVRAHQNVEVLTVTADNRDTIPSMLLDRFGG